MAGLLLLNSVPAWAEPKAFIRSNGQFVANGNEYARGFWTPGVQGASEVFAIDPLAAQEYQDHLDDAKWFGILNWGAVGVFATYALIAASNDNYKSGIGLTLFVIPWLGGIYMGAKSNSHLLKAINLVNGIAPDQAQMETQRWHYVGAKPLEVPVLAWTF